MKLTNKISGFRTMVISKNTTLSDQLKSLVSIFKLIMFYLLISVAMTSVARANPQTPTVVHGTATFESINQLLEITNSNGAIIDWQSFSIGQDELTRFLQQSGSSAVLNRVIGSDISSILGGLQSNGQVFVINPNGIVIGSSAVIDTRGFLASTLDISNEDFAAGILRFSGDGGSIDNRGLIRVDGNGNIALIAPDITNSGILQTDNGQITLAAGREIEISAADNRDIMIKVQAPEDSVVNLGKIIAEEGTIGLFAGNLNQQGELRFTRDASGRVFLEADTNRVSGSITAPGGDVQILGDHITLDASLIDASSHSGGGRVLVGGDFQGGNGVRTALTTTISRSSEIYADAMIAGNGGEIIVWSENMTQVDGSLFARGGTISGNGGFIETSSHGVLEFNKPADVSALAGDPGVWLIDPEDINIDGGKASSIETALNQGSSVVIQTSDSGSGEGNISVNAPITKTEGGDASLSLVAHNQIDVNQPIQSTSNKLNVNLRAGRSVRINSEINTNGGSLSSVITGVTADPDEDIEEAEETAIEEIAEDQGQTQQVTSDTEIKTAQDNEGAEEIVESPDSETDEQVISNASDTTEAIIQVNADILTSGGDINIDTQSFGAVAIDAIVDASAIETGQQGATIEITTEDLALNSSLLASSASGFGGLVDIQLSGDGIDDSTAIIDVSGTTGGDIRYIAEGDVALSGEYLATGSVGDGGNIDISATDIQLLSASLDTSGETSGGRIRIGGEYQGGKGLAVDELPNARKLLVDKNTTIKANGLGSNASGGEVILWSEEQTIALGNILAHQATNAIQASELATGGFVEVSSKGLLHYDGSINAGVGGLVFFDPANLAVGSAPTVHQAPFPATNPFSIITAASITAITNLGTAVDLVASNDLYVRESIITNNPGGDGGAITLRAGRDLVIENGAIIDTQDGNFTARANETIANGVVDSEREAGDAELRFSLDSIIFAGTGNVSFELTNDTIKTNNTARDISIDGRIESTNLTVQGNSIEVFNDAMLIATNDVMFTGDIISNSGNVNGGNVTFNGDVQNSGVVSGSNVLFSGFNINVSGAITGDNIRLDGDMIEVSVPANIMATNNVNLTATQQITNSATITGNNVIFNDLISSNNDITLSGTSNIMATNEARLAAGQQFMNSGAISGNLVVLTGNNIAISGASNIMANTDVGVNAGQQLTHSGTINAINIMLSGGTTVEIFNPSNITATNDATITANQRVTNSGTINGTNVMLNGLEVVTLGTSNVTATNTATYRGTDGFSFLRGNLMANVIDIDSGFGQLGIDSFFSTDPTLFNAATTLTLAGEAIQLTSQTFSTTLRAGSIFIDTPGSFTVDSGDVAGADVIVDALDLNTITINASTVTLSDAFGANVGDVLLISGNGAGTINITTNTCTNCDPASQTAGTDIGFIGIPVGFAVPAPAVPPAPEPVVINNAPAAVEPPAAELVVAVENPEPEVPAVQPAEVDDIIDQVVNLIANNAQIETELASFEVLDEVATTESSSNESNAGGIESNPERAGLQCSP